MFKLCLSSQNTLSSNKHSLYLKKLCLLLIDKVFRDDKHSLNMVLDKHTSVYRSKNIFLSDKLCLSSEKHSLSGKTMLKTLSFDKQSLLAKNSVYLNYWTFGVPYPYMIQYMYTQWKLFLNNVRVAGKFCLQVNLDCIVPCISFSSIKNTA